MADPHTITKIYPMYNNICIVVFYDNSRIKKYIFKIYKNLIKIF